MQAQAMESGPHAITEKLKETPRLALDRLPVLDTLLERLATSCAESLREFCPAPFSAFVNQVEIRDSWDLLEAFEDSIAVIFYAPEWDARILIGVERRFVYSLIEAMLGGDGTEKPFEAVRPFTLLETRIGKAVCEIAAQAFAAAFAQVCEISLHAEKTETTLEFTTLGQTNMLMVNAQILFQVLDMGGRAFVFIPQAALYPMRQRLERERAANPAAADPWWATKMQNGVAQTEVSLEATFEGNQLTLGEISRLQVGQILGLRGTDRNMTLECAGQRLFRCQLGQADGYFTVTAGAPIDEQEELLVELMSPDGAALTARG